MVILFIWLIPRSHVLSSETMRELIFFLLISSMFCHATSKTLNYLERGSYLSVEDDSAFLTSPDNSFSCGFYEVGRNAYGFGIWFTHSRNRTVVWMANRDKPVNGHASKISFRRDGAMVLIDLDGLIVWETNTSSTNAHRAELHNSGNLVIRDPQGKILWQSFDFPTDTLLPSQLFTKSMKLVSALRNGSYSSGYYTFSFSNDHVLKLIYEGPELSSIYWPNPDQSIYQNGRRNYNSSRIAVLDKMGRFLSSDRLQFSASDMGFGVKRRLTMDFDGNLRLYSLKNSTGLWEVSWQAISQHCIIHGLCGRFGLCVYTPEPKCTCPPGYVMSDPGNWHQGCRPSYNLSSSKPPRMKFVELLNADYYGFDLNNTRASSMEACTELCLGDDRCGAFSYRITGEGLCFTKSVMFNGFISPNFPGRIYLKVPVSVGESRNTPVSDYSLECRSTEAEVDVGSAAVFDIGGKKVRWVYLYAFASVIGGIEVLVLISVCIFFRRNGLPDTVKDGYEIIASQFRKFSYYELKRATENFKEELGRGASGVVYKGVLEDKREVAVKRLGDALQGEEEFWAEVSTIRRIYHMNLVRIWGFCSEGKHRLLVYECIKNRSLDKHLFSRTNFLGWKERFKVALGTARALAYLHHECLEWVIHCDVKPENILLDNEFHPKVADFGLAKLCKRSGLGSEFSRIRGTKGYMAPEWAMNLPITAKVDVYSYGVVILEMVRGVRFSSLVVEGAEEETEFTRFVRTVKGKMQHGEDFWLEDVVDSRLGGTFSRNQVATMVEIGLSCIEEDRSKRPTMASVVQVLVDCDDESEILCSPTAVIAIDL